MVELNTTLKNSNSNLLSIGYNIGKEDGTFAGGIFLTFKFLINIQCLEIGTP